MVAVELPPIAYQAPGNFCRACSPIGRTIGEPGQECCRCGGPVQPSDMELAATRAARNALRLVRSGPGG